MKMSAQFYPCLRFSPFRSLQVVAHGIMLFLIVLLASALGSAAAGAQTASVQTFGASNWDTYSGVISASDGNFYAVSTDEDYGGFTAADFACPGQSAGDCTFIDKITPSGTVTALHTFLTNGFGAHGGAPNTDGFGPTPLVEGADGNLYGSASSGGTAGFGTIFKISITGTFTLLYTFPNTGTEANPVAPSGAYPSRLIFGKDGNLYGTSQQLDGGYYFFQVTPTGAFTIIATSTVPGDVAPQSVVQGSDGTFYAVNGVAFEQITLGGAVNTLHPFVMNQSQTFQPLGSLAEGPDHNFYGTDRMAGAILQISPSGSVNVIHYVSPANATLVSPELTLGSDGNLYGTTYIGGITDNCSSGTQAGNGIGCGTVFQVTPSGQFTNLYNFLGTSADGAQPDGWLLQGGDGSFYGTFFNPTPNTYNNLFQLSPIPALPAPIKITFSPQNPQPTKQVTVNWSVLNAFSATMQQCHGSVVGGPPSGPVAFGTGPLTGGLTNNIYGGTYTFTPALPGLYTFTLNCGGIETGSAKVVVGSGVQILTTSLPGGTVTKLYNGIVQATGGTGPYNWGVSGTGLPLGLQSSPDAAGDFLINGIPTQFGNYTFTIGLLDSSNPQQAASQTYQVVIASGLTLVPALGNNQVGVPYNQTATASGGIAPYKWALASGKLPDGLTLNVNTGTIAGTPTVAGKFNFSITVQDNEGTPATVTQAYTVSITVPPLQVVNDQKFDCKVNSVCAGSFAATGGTPPYTWTVVPQPPQNGQSAMYFNLPPTISVATSGAFSGVPLQWAVDPNITVAVQVTDSEVPAVTSTGIVTFSIDSDLKIVSVPLPTAYVGTYYQSPLPVATGGVPPYEWFISAPPKILAEWLVNPVTGQLVTRAGLPGPITAGTFKLGYSVVDSEGVSAQVDLDVTLTVLPALPVNSATTLSSSSTSAGTGMNVTLTANVTATNVVPSGVVTFFNGTVSLGTATLDTTGKASLTTVFNTAGTYTLTASYAGGGAVLGSISAPITETVVAPTVSASVTPGSITIQPGQSGTMTISITPSNGYTGTVNFSCGSLPAHVSCTFAPPSLTIAAGAGLVTDVLTINTAAQAVALAAPPDADRRRPTRQNALALAFGLPGLFGMMVFSGKDRRCRMRRLICLAVIAGEGMVGLGSLTGCGAEASGANARAGAYTIPVTLTLSGGATQTVNAAVVVR